MHIFERDQVVVVSVLGEQCAGLWKALEPYVERGRRGFVLDLAQIAFLNSVNIAAIIAARNKVSNAGGRMAIANLADNIKAVFRILKLERLFDLDSDLDTACRLVI